MKSPSKRSLIVLFIIISIICILFFAAIGRFNAPLANSIVVNVLAPFQSVTSAVSSKCTAHSENDDRTGAFGNRY